MSLIKNLKQVGLSQVVSTALVVQGVAVQQSAVNDFSQQEALVQEMNDQAVSQRLITDESNFSQEKYWNDVVEVIESAPSNEIQKSPEVVAVAEAFEEAISESSSATPPSGSSSASSLVAVASPSPQSSQSSNSSPSVSPSSNSRAPNAAAVGGINGLNSKPVEEAKPDVADASSEPVQVSAETVVTASIKDSQEEDDEEVVVVEPTPTPTPAPDFDSYLEVVNLYRENTLVQSLSDGDQVVVEESNNFEIQIEEQDDIGSLRFTLTNSDTNAIVHSQNENLPPFQLGGGNGVSIAEGNYSLLIQFFDNDNFSGDPVAERSLSFSLSHPAQAGPLDNSLALYRNGVFEAYVNNGDTLYLNSSDNYNLQVESQTDFGSVHFDLSATNANSNGGGHENNLPYELSNSRNGFNFVTANYDLTLIAYPSNGQDDPPLQTLSINFDVIVQ